MGKHLTTDEFIQKSLDIHGDTYDYSMVIYNNNRTKVNIKCKIHGIFIQRPSHHLRGQGCPLCGKLSCVKTKTDSINDFILKSKIVHGNNYDYTSSQYTKSDVKINITCHKHGEFYQTPNNHLSGKGCPYCASSRGENAIRSIFEKYNISFVQQKKFTECRYIKPLAFDFYIPSINTCIEYDGIQHFKSVECWGGTNALDLQQTKDSIKDEYCKNKDIHLLRISYKSNIEDVILSEIISKIHPHL